jgi:hypothetical protein
MSILFYAPIDKDITEKYKRAIETAAPNETLEIYHTIDCLARRLFQPKYTISVAIFWAATKQDLSDIVSLRDWFDGVRLILILPDDEQDTVRKGHTLFPRFLSFIDSDFVMITSVLKKMVQKNLS